MEEAVLAGKIERDDEVAVEASVVTVECEAGTSKIEEPLALLVLGVSNAEDAVAVDEER